MQILTAVLMLFPIVLIGCLLPLLGRTRRGLLFGVTVPLEFADSPAGRAAVRRYRNSVVLLAFTVAVTALLVLYFGPLRLRPLLSTFAIPAELLGAMLLWQRERRAIKPHAIAVPLERTTELLPQRHLGGIVASVAALLPLALTALWLQRRWALIPVRWPQHWDAYGHVNGWGVRSAASVFAPLILGALLVLLMTAVAAFLAFAPGPQSRQRRLVVAPLAGLAWLMAGMFCGIGFLPLWHSLSPTGIVAMVIAHMLATLGVVVWLLWRSGIMNVAQAAPYDSTPDAMWRGGGLIYFNPTDAAVLVPKRYGFGWTLNFARPAAWAYIAAVLLVLVLVLLLPHHHS
jgi:uncharacterized membrane protein